MRGPLSAGTASHYKHIEAVNDDLPFDFYYLNSFFKAKTGRARAEQKYIEEQSLNDLVLGMSGMKCLNLTGSTGAGFWSDDEVRNVVGAIKTHVLSPQPEGNPIVEFPFVAYGMDLIRSGKDLTGAGCEKRVFDGAFHFGYYDRKIPGLYFADDFSVTKPFDLPGSGVLIKTGGFSSCDVGLSHPAATPTTAYPTVRALPPRQRVRAFIGSHAPIDGCGAAHQLVQALTVACFAGDNRATIPSTSIEIRDPSQVPALRRWVASVARDARTRLGEFYVLSLPKRVVSEITKEGLGASAKKGTKGEQIVEAANAIEAIKSSWLDVAEQLDQLGTAIERAHLEINAASLDEREKIKRLLIDRWQAVARMVGAVADAVSVNPLTVATQSVKATAVIAAATAEIQIGTEIETIAKEQSSNRSALAMVGLRTEALSRGTQLQKSLTQIKVSANLLQTTAEKLERLENKARYESAKGSGDDYYTTSTGDVVPIPVNTVLRRQYSIARIRYDQALNDAKYLAFLARRAIEQRIGVPLDKIPTKVGTLEAPASWADDVCRLEGINYDKLRTAGTGDSGLTENDYAKELANQYIGDYVAKLENFVEFYNVQFPSHEGDDTAIYSLKDDLLSPPSTCLADASNLLLYSGRLSKTVGPTETLPPGDGRWQAHACGTKCLQVYAGSALPESKEPPPDASRGEVSWLFDVASSGGDGGGDAGVDASSETAKGPTGLVSQKVHLKPGTYVLSWWDQARTTDGKIAVTTPVSYRAGVFDATFGAISSATPIPHVATTAAPWSPRRSVSVVIAAEGDYFVSFGASLLGSGSLGSVAIANVQLETAAAGGLPSAYVATDSSHKVVSASCPAMSSSDLRAAFERRCTPGGVCWYELTTPFLIDTGLVKSPTAEIVSKLAKGNFNYRHISLSLNLVGTGVRSCEATPTPDCFGSGFTEFTMQHVADRAGILDWNGDVRLFDFATAYIEHGRALSAERFITMPIGSADNALLTQPGIEKPELRGRPLDGVYRLSIWDSPALKWSRLDDIQVIVKYRYWSRVRRDAKGE